jgi:two-component system, response regulator PdtaR
MKSVLIVDDEPTVRKVVTETLSETEFSFIEADNAAQPLQTLREAGPKISVLLTDVMMPGQLNGIELAKLTHNSWPWIKVIVTTGFPDAVAGKLPPKVRFLPKPWWPDDILDQVRDASGDFDKIQAAASVH